MDEWKPSPTILRTKMNIPDIKNALKEGLVKLRFWFKIKTNDVRQKHSILYKTRNCFWRIMIYYYCKLRISIPGRSSLFKSLTSTNQI